jgi:hypothetical protein
MRIRFSPLRALAGATALVVPSAIGVHLAAESIALGGDAAHAAFWLRHAYLSVPLALALWSFARTAGLGCGRAEMVRRCALARARLREAGGGSTLAAFALANLAFFALTQTLEGVPIAGPSIGVGIAAAVFGSLLSALVVYGIGRSIVAIALAAVARLARSRRGVAPARVRLVVLPRAAASAFSLFVPNRPPPAASFG